MNNNIKVEVDYFSNNCIISGFCDGQIKTINRPITGLNDHMAFSRNYSGKKIKNMREYMTYRMEKFQEENPDFEYSRKLINNVDPLIFDALNRWDMMEDTNYAMDYLKSIVQIYDKNKFVGKTKDAYEEECKLARANELRKSGIDISYNVALLNTPISLSIADKIRGIKIAEMQEKLYGAKVTKNLIIKNKSKNIESNDLKIVQSEENNSEEKNTQTHTINTKKEPSEFKMTKSNQSNNKNEEIEIKKEHKKNIQQPTKKTKKSVEKRFEREKKKNAYEAAKLKKAEENNALKKAKQEKLEKERLESERIAKLKVEQEKNETTKKKDDENLKAQLERKAMVKAKRAEKVKEEQERFLKAKAEAEKLVKEKEKENSPFGFFKGIIGKIKKDNNNEKENSKGHWGRKLLNAKDSIENKTFIKKEDAKKIAVTGVATLLAAGSLVSAINVSNNSDNYNIPIVDDENATSISENVKYNSPDVPEIYNVVSSNLIEKNNTKTDNQKEKSKKDNLNEENFVKEDNVAKEDITQKSNEEKIQELKNFAFKKYMSLFVIGEKPRVGNILNKLYFSENPDGSGNLGSFKKHPNYDISHINIVTKDGAYKTVNIKGESLEELLDECTDYSIHFVDSKTGSGYGFIQKAQLEDVVNEAIDAKIDELMDSILNENNQTTNNNNELDVDDWMI